MPARIEDNERSDSTLSNAVQMDVAHRWMVITVQV